MPAGRLRAFTKRWHYYRHRMDHFACPATACKRGQAKNVCNRKFPRVQPPEVSLNLARDRPSRAIKPVPSPACSSRTSGISRATTPPRGRAS